MLEYILPKLPRYSVLTEARGKAALVWILGEYGEVSCRTLHEYVSQD